MAKKKDLKHTINCICSDLFAEAVAASLYGSEKNTTDAQQLLSSIIVLRDDFVKRISHPEPGLKARQYYNNLIDDFNHQISDIIDQISNLG
jgi:hypothetical protein